MFYRPLCGVGGQCQGLAGGGDKCDLWNNRGRNAVTGGFAADLLLRFLKIILQWCSARRLLLENSR